MTQAQAFRSASCACGGLAAECAGEPGRVSLCHCLECQRRTGSTYGIAAFYSREAVTIAGESRAWTRSSDSGEPVTFHFCPTCGGTVYWEPKRTPGRIAVAVGAFADPQFPAPEKEVYEQHRHRWAATGL
jgi:hypothetical protein